MLGFHLPSALVVLGTVLSVAAKGSPSHCSSVTFHLSATAENFAFLDPPDPNNATQIQVFMDSALGSGVAINGTQTVSATVGIHGVYCKPTANFNKHPDALQILVHGVTYNSTMWTGYGFGEQYDWHTFANGQGYHTLAIDRLGHGLNARIGVDPLNVVQGPMHVELIHKLITAVRTNTGNALDRGFSKIAYIGHSFGSIVGTQIARVYPSDADAIVLTGWSTTINFTTAQDFFKFEPAAIHNPSRFPSVPLGYVTTISEALREGAFYGGAYDHRIPQFDYVYEDIVTDGEFGSLGYLVQVAVGYTNPLMVVTGVDDAIFCSPTQSTCDAILAASAANFPNSTHFEYFAPANTGHDLTLHFSAPESLGKVHEFLAKFL